MDGWICHIWKNNSQSNNCGMGCKHPFVPTLCNSSFLQINRKGRRIAVSSKSSERKRQQFENGCLGIHLYMVALFFFLLFNVLNHTAIWSEVKWVSNALIKSALLSFAITVCIFPHIDEPALYPDRCKGIKWVSRTVREQTVRQQGQTSGCYWEAWVILQGWIIHGFTVRAILCFEGPLDVTYNETRSFDFKAVDKG